MMIKIIMLVLALVVSFISMWLVFKLINRKRNKGFNGDGLGFYVSVIILTTILFIGLRQINIPIVYSDGIKTGSLAKFTKKGLLFKTWEGQLNLGGMVSNGDGGMVANVWNFSVTDEKIIKQLQETQGRVSLSYDEFLIVPITTGSSNYIIKEVK